MKQTELCNVAILAGGQGTRLSSRTKDLPKPMVPIMGKPVLQHQIELCRRFGFTNIAILVHHKHHAISSYFGDGSQLGVQLRYQVEEAPRGTAGALRDALSLMATQFLVLYGDTYFDIDLGIFFNEHCTSGANATLFLHPNDHPYDSDLVNIDTNGFVRGIHPYPHGEDLDLRNLVNAALYAVSKQGLEIVTPEFGKADIAKHMFPEMLSRGLLLKGYISPEYIKDMGTPDRMDKVERDIESGLPERLSNRHLRKAVFLDRDGTLNKEINHLHSPDQMELLPKAGEALQILNRAGFLSVVITNQPVVARGDVTIDGLEHIHARLETLLGRQRSYLDAIYYCPHHPDKGFNGEVPELKIECNCRKPGVGLIDRAVGDLSISRADSWMIGDTTTDIEAGRRAGLKTILLRTGYAGSDQRFNSHPDYTATNLFEAVQWATVGHFHARKRLAPIAIRVLDEYRVVLVGGLARSGKSSAAQILKELLSVYGKSAHVISLDGWLKPSADRKEGSGVLNRYDLDRATLDLSNLVNCKQRTEFYESVYDRASRSKARFQKRHSVGSNDVLIIEGVPALSMNVSSVKANTFKLFIESNRESRLQRLKQDYGWRSYSAQEIDELLHSRAKDEELLITESARSADEIISWEA